MSGRSRFTIAERLAAKTVAGPNGCLLFTGYRDTQGYARIYDGVEKRLVHRVAYELYIGPIPDGLQVDHLCGVRHCVNPAHLEAVTALENTRRAARGNAQRTHCVNGHEFTPENTRLHQRRRGGLTRICRQCDAARAQQRRGRDHDSHIAVQRAYYQRNRALINARRRERYAERKAA